ncbi:beta-1,3-galactosyltransferase 5-like [Haliotis cracherodii]|uniref:beta-1,3-galactosyltransferase 5-like n=1 Tax=Haliotis cracherodii TaxID=6455 RepID=UPI0039E72E8A
MASKYHCYIFCFVILDIIMTFVLIWFAMKGSDHTFNGMIGQHILWDKARSHSKKYKISIQSADPNFKIVRQNRDLCTSTARVHALFVVHTAPSNRKRRDVIRDMLTSDVINRKYTIRILFLIGWPTTFVRRTQGDIREETKQHRDILQGRFLDTYRNLTYKAVFGFKWISRHCKNVHYVIKMDDDVYVDMYNFFSTLYPRFETRHAVICKNMAYSKVFRYGRWRVDDHAYRHYAYFPVKYCSGYAVVFKGDMVPLLYKASLMAPFFWIDDVFIYGTSRTFLRFVSIPQAQTGMYFQLNGSKAIECFKNAKPCPVIFSSFNQDTHKLEQFRRNFLKLRTQDLLL